MYATVLKVILLITNERLRGVWSMVMILAALLVSVFLAWFGWWDEVLRTFEVAGHPHANLASVLPAMTAGGSSG